MEKKQGEVCNSTFESESESEWYKYIMPLVSITMTSKLGESFINFIFWNCQWDPDNNDKGSFINVP